MKFYIYGHFSDTIELDDNKFEQYLAEHEDYMAEPEGEEKEEWRRELLHDFVYENWYGDNVEFDVEDMVDMT